MRLAGNDRLRASAARAAESAQDAPRTDLTVDELDEEERWFAERPRAALGAAGAIVPEERRSA